MTATVEADRGVDAHRDAQGAQGQLCGTVVRRKVTKFSEIKVGDKITAATTKYRPAACSSRAQKSVDSDSTAVTKSGAKRARPRQQRTITATITGDRHDGAVDYLRRPEQPDPTARSVEDKKMLAKVKVGDKVDITWTEALMIPFDTPAK